MRQLYHIKAVIVTKKLKQTVFYQPAEQDLPLVVSHLQGPIQLKNETNTNADIYN